MRESSLIRRLGSLGEYATIGRLVNAISSRPYETVAVVVLVLLHLLSQWNMRFILPDGLVYSFNALELAKGRLTFGERAPLLQLMLAFCFRLFGATQTSAVIAPQLVGVLTTVLVYLVAAEMYGKKTGSVAFVLAMINLNLINFSAQVLRETLLAALVLICLYVTFRYKGRTRLLLLGSSIGLLYWVREDYLAIILPLIVYLGWGKKERLRTILTVIGMAVLVGAPWAYYSFTTFGTIMPSLQVFRGPTGGHAEFFAISPRSFVVILGGIYYGLHLVPSILSLFAFFFLAVGIFSGFHRRQLLPLAIAGLMIIVDSRAIFSYVGWPMPWSWTNSSRYIFPSTLPLLAISAKGIMRVADLSFSTNVLRLSRLARIVQRRRLEGVLLIGVLVFGAGLYGLLQDFSAGTNLPYAAAGTYMRTHSINGPVMAFHPELLSHYYGGKIYAMPNPATFTAMLDLARAKNVSFVLVDWSMPYLSEDAIRLYFDSQGYPSALIPSEFSFVAGELGIWGLFAVHLTS